MGGSDHFGDGKAPKHIVKLGTEIAVAVDVVGAAVLPEPEPVVHSDSDDHSGVDSDSDGEPVGHLYPFLVNTSQLGFLWLQTVCTNDYANNS